MHVPGQRPDAMKLGIVVLNWNGKDVTPRCLDSIYRSSTPPDTIVVVDNASGDRSADLIHEQFPQVVLIENDCNLGFAEGCNVGIRYLLERQFDLILLLNNDAVVDSACICELKRAADSHPAAAAYAATIYELSDPGKIWFGGGTISQLTLNARHDTQALDKTRVPRPTQFITGCCLLMRSDAVRKIGLLDSNFFAYFEDVDWCLRALAAGDQLIYVPDAKVYHDVSFSFRKAGAGVEPALHLWWARKRPLVLHLTYRNRLILARKHARGRAHLGVLTAYCAVRAVLHIVLLSLAGRSKAARAVLGGFRDGLVAVPTPFNPERYIR